MSTGRSNPSPALRALKFTGSALSLAAMCGAALAALVLIIIPLVTGSQTYTVLTSSMAPNYAPGTFLVVKPTPADQLKTGDVITYQIESGDPTVITHRIIGISSGQNGERLFTTQGDNNDLADEGVKAIRLLAILWAVFLTLSCSRPPVSVTQSRDLPYARCTLTLTDHSEEATFAACFARIEEVLRDLDMYNADSEIASVNRAAGVKAVRVSDDVREVLREGLALAALTDGRFDPTVGPLVRLWGIGGDKARVPGPEEIRSALRLVGWREVIVDDAAKTVVLRRAGMALDFGALAKGYAVVEAGRVLSRHGVGSAIMDLGGSVLALGSQPGGRPWRIGLQKPAAPRGTPLGVLLARDEVINTSGAYERFFTANGRRYHHIMDTRTGYPVENGVEAVTVVSPRLRNADGPSLSIMALGVEQGLALAKQLGVDAVIIGSDRTLHMTPGARRRFTLLDTTYRIASP